jgi:hypothetical protein
MSKDKLRYVSAGVSRELQNSISTNLDRYLSGNFDDLAGTGDWAIQLKFEADLEPLANLVKAPDDDAANSLVVWKALSHLPPSLAVEGRIWTRLSHVEGLPYARARWIRANKGQDAVKVIEDHFFGNTRTECRDDNAIGRLWWGAYIAHLAMPTDHEEAIKAIWKTADIRSNIIERSWTSSRPDIAAGILRAIRDRSEVTTSEDAFRDFMKALNAAGGGVLFEQMTQAEIDSFVDSCIS